MTQPSPSWSARPSWHGATSSDGEDFYSPDYVSDPTPRDDGLEMWLDCKDLLNGPMATAFRRSLTEDLEAAGLDDVWVVKRPWV